MIVKVQAQPGIERWRLYDRHSDLKRIRRSGYGDLGLPYNGLTNPNRHVGRCWLSEIKRVVPQKNVERVPRNDGHWYRLVECCVIADPSLNLEASSFWSPCRGRAIDRRWSMIAQRVSIRLDGYQSIGFEQRYALGL